MQSTQVRRAFGGVIAAVSLLLVQTLPSFAAPSVAPRIINGTPGNPAEFPFLVALLNNDLLGPYGAFKAQFCAGTLTGPTTVVTAAHCVVNQDSGVVQQPAKISIGIGANLRDPGLRIIGVTQITVNPDYSRRASSNDVAILTLAQAVTDVASIAPLTPAEAPAYTAVGSLVRVAGWGNMSTTGEVFPDAFYVGDLVVFPDSTCGRGQPYLLNGVPFDGFTEAQADPVSMLCAGGVTPALLRVDSCQGDSGGPLIGGTGPGARLIGIVSWGNDCANTYPGVYTRVSAEYDFIKANTGGGTVPPPPTSSAPIAAPIITVQAQSGAVRVSFVAAPDGTTVKAFAASVLDPVTGLIVNCFSQPRGDGGPAVCIATGLTNGIAYSVNAISGNNVGNSPVSAATVVTPHAVPTPGRIRKATALSGGRAVFKLTPTADNGSPLLSHRVICLPIPSGPFRVARVSGATVTIDRLQAGTDYSCFVRARNALGPADSLPITVSARK
jgi:secreted trypsin-like serine protease